MMDISLLEILGYFSMWSLMAVGGAAAVLPEMYQQVVVNRGWMSGSQFMNLFALAQAAPGPNVLAVSLIGYKLSGIGGALTATVGMCGPSSLLSFGVSRVWDRFAAASWRGWVERALTPLTIGLVLASGCILAGRGMEATPLHWLLLAGTIAIATVSRINPLYLLATGAAAGMLAIL